MSRVVFLFILLFFGNLTYAEERYYLLDRNAILTFQPYKVTLFAVFEKGVRAVEASLSEIAESEQGKVYLVVGIFPDNGFGKPESTAVLIEGVEGERVQLLPQAVTLEEKHHYDRAVIEELTVATKRVLSQYQEKVKKGKDSLARLKRDLDTVSNIGRIVQVRTELTSKEDALKQVREMRERITKNKSALIEVNTPTEQQRRERELLYQGALLAQMKTKKAGAAPLVNQDFLSSLVDTYQPETLIEEWNHLRERRKALEMGGSNMSDQLTGRKQ